MSNLRSDCRDLVKDREPGDVWRSHIERLCFQIDDLEEKWHDAERRAKAERARRLDLFSAAALTGLCMGRAFVAEVDFKTYAKDAWRLAEAMLAEQPGE